MRQQTKFGGVYELDGSSALVLIYQFWWLGYDYVGKIFVYRNYELKYLQIFGVSYVQLTLNGSVFKKLKKKRNSIEKISIVG